MKTILLLGTECHPSLTSLTREGVPSLPNHSVDANNMVSPRLGWLAFAREQISQPSTN